MDVLSFTGVTPPPGRNAPQKIVQPTIPVTFEVLSPNPTSASTPTSHVGATCQLTPKWAPIRGPDVSKACGLDASVKNGSLLPQIALAVPMMGKQVVFQ